MISFSRLSPRANSRDNIRGGILRTARRNPFDDYQRLADVFSISTMVIDLPVKSSATAVVFLCLCGRAPGRLCYGALLAAVLKRALSSDEIVIAGGSQDFTLGDYIQKTTVARFHISDKMKA